MTVPFGFVGKREMNTGYWGDQMNWHIVKDWKCQTCGAEAYYLEWGIVNGLCRCSQCHTHYMMRDGTEVVDTPIVQLRPEYVEAAKVAWKTLGKNVDEVTDDEWEALGVVRGAL